MAGYPKNQYGMPLPASRINQERERPSAEWNEGEYSHLPTFTLKAIDHKILELVLDHRRIIRTWELQFHRGEIPENTHPNIPGHYFRFVELDSKIRSFLASAQVAATDVVGIFKVIKDQETLPAGVLWEVRVAWQVSTIG